MDFRLAISDFRLSGSFLPSIGPSETRESTITNQKSPQDV